MSAPLNFVLQTLTHLILALALGLGTGRGFSEVLMFLIWVLVHEGVLL